MKIFCIRISKFVLPLLALASISFTSQAQNGLTINGKTCVGSWSLSSSTTGTAITVPDSCLGSTTACTATGTPTITSFTPTAGNATTVITITGTNLCNVTAVTVNGTAATGITSGAGTSISATVGAGTTTGPVVVTANGAVSQPSTTNFTVAALVTLTSLSPSPFTQGAFITMNGTNFVPGDVYINIGATRIPTSTSSTTTATAYVPASLANGNYQVTVTTNGQTTAALPLQIGPVTGCTGGDTSIEGDCIPSPSRTNPGGKTAYRSGKLNGMPGSADPNYPLQFNSYAADNVATKCANATPAITRLWQHNINFATYQSSGGNDYPFLAPNEAMTWKFVAPAEGSPAQQIQYNEGTQVFTARGFLSISTKPCDFDVSKLVPGPNYNFCYASEVNGISIAYRSTTGSIQYPTECKLTPGQTYYLNLRMQDARPASLGGSPTVDSCAASGAGICGGFVQIR
jgi:IPT/TIG domain